MIVRNPTGMFLAAALLSMTPLAACTPYYGDPGVVEGWNNEDAYWRQNYVNEPYYANGLAYESYQPAYLYGVESYRRYKGRRFEELNEAELRTQWEHTHGAHSHMDWEHSRAATRAAYNRMAAAHSNSAPSHVVGHRFEEHHS